MQPVDSNTFKFALLLGAIIVGIVCGIAPLVTGFVKKQIGLGIIGFVGSLIGGILLGILLALPVAAVFTVIIALRRTASDSFIAPPNPPDFHN